MFEEDEAIRVYVPPGWPGGVRPPKSEGWLESVTAFLLDCCPPDYRSYPVLVRHPVVLARCAQQHVTSQVEAAKLCCASLRTELGEFVSHDVMDAAIMALQREQARLVRTQRAVSLVQDALQDVRFVPKL